jgi:MFS family permease
VIFLTVFIDLLGFGIVIPLLPRYAAFLQMTGRDRSLTPEEPVQSTSDDATSVGWRSELTPAQNAIIGLLMSSFSAMQFLFAPVWGRLSDRVGRRPVLILGLLSSALFYGLFAFATHIRSLPLLFLARIGAGVAGATIPTAQAYIADCTPPEERGRGMALIGAAFGIGFTFGPLLGSFWVSDDPAGSPSSAPGVVAAGLSFLAFCLAVVILPESLPPGSGSVERGWLNLAALRAGLRVPAIGSLLLVFFVATVAFAGFEGTLARLTRDGFGLSDRDNFFLFAYIGLLLSLSQGLFVRRMMLRLGELTLTVLGALLMTVGLAGLAVAAWQSSQAVLLAVLPIAVLGFASLTPSVQSLISRRSDPSIQGGVLGLAQSVSSLARILGPLLGNLLYGYRPAYTLHTLPYVLGAALMALALVLTLGLTRHDSVAPSPIR